MKKQSTIRGATYITIGRILSKIIGLFRERLFAVYFGTSYVLDVLRLGISLFGLIVGAVISPILRYGLPNITQAYEEENWGHIKHNLQVITLMAGGLGVVLSAILILFPQPIVRWFLPYLTGDPHKFTVATNMFRAIGILTLVYVFTTILENILIAIHIYTHLGIKDPLINTIWTTVVAISPGALSLVWGRTLGALLYALFAAWILYKAISYMKANFSHEGAPSRKYIARDIFMGTLPMYLGGSISLINQFVDRTMAGYLGEGNIAIIGYGGVIAGIIGSLLIQPFVQSIYPKVSAYIRGNDIGGFLRETHHIMEVILFFSIPALIALIFLPYRISYFFFGGDKMSTSALTTIGVVASIMAYVQVFTATGIYTSAFTPMKRTDIGMKISLVVVPLNIILNYVLAFTLHMGPIGLKIATAIAITLGNTTALYILSRMIGGLHLKTLVPSTLKTLLATLSMSIFIVPLDKILPQTRVFTLLIVAIGMSVYFITAYIERHEVLDSIIDKFSSLLS